MDRWLQEHLVCPRDHRALAIDGQTLVCAEGHAYPYVDGIPIMLLYDVQPTHVAFHETRSRVASGAPADRAGDAAGSPEAVDPFVQDAVAGTCGNMYRQMVRRLTAYPIPELRLPPGAGQSFLDVGCNWGRWCVSAAQKGYSVIGIDPSLDAIRAARRVAAQLGVSAAYVVADARHLPFAAGAVDLVFSYSVLQHFDKADAVRALEEIGRVLKAPGTATIQMPNTFGLRNLYHQARRGFRRPTAFEVRYWSPDELRRAFERAIGPTRLSVDGYFSLNAQVSDRELLAPGFGAVISSSEHLRRLSGRFPWLVGVADSLYVTSVRSLAGPPATASAE